MKQIFYMLRIGFSEAKQQLKQLINSKRRGKTLTLKELSQKFSHGKRKIPARNGGNFEGSESGAKDCR